MFLLTSYFEGLFPEMIQIENQNVLVRISFTLLVEAAGFVVCRDSVELKSDHDKDDFNLSRSSLTNVQPKRKSKPELTVQYKILHLGRY